MALVQECQEDEAATTPNKTEEGTLMNFSGGSKLLAINPVETASAPEANPEQSSKIWLARHTAVEVLNGFGWDTWSDKIVALGAYHEAKAGARTRSASQGGKKLETQLPWRF